MTADWDIINASKEEQAKYTPPREEVWDYSPEDLPFPYNLLRAEDPAAAFAGAVVEAMSPPSAAVIEGKQRVEADLRKRIATYPRLPQTLPPPSFFEEEGIPLHPRLKGRDGVGMRPVRRAECARQLRLSAQMMAVLPPPPGSGSCPLSGISVEEALKLEEFIISIYDALLPEERELRDITIPEARSNRSEKDILHLLPAHCFTFTAARRRELLLINIEEVQ